MQNIFAQEVSETGGGYAVTGQISQTGYTCKIYDATNGLPTSDANYILCSSDGYIWICGYAGVIRYDGSVFERLPPTNGLTSGRVLFEDSRHRIWVGTNDNGVVVIDGEKTRHYTFREGLPSSSIRTFAEDYLGNVFIGTTSGLAYVDNTGRLIVLSEPRLNSERILKLDSDKNGKIYGLTKDGVIFAIVRCNVTEVYSSSDMKIEKITALLADSENPGKVYLGTEGSSVLYGTFGQKADVLKKISVAPLENIHWLSFDCGRLWVSSTTMAGYLDEKNQFKLPSNIPMDSAIEMTTSDYQGNIWMASSTQGIMKLVTNNFINLSEQAKLPDDTVNATCVKDKLLYIGTDRGLQILDDHNQIVKNKLTDFIGNARVRCITADKQGNLWFATYTNNLGIVCQKKDGTIKTYTKADGLLSNQIRCVEVASDGSLLAGTNGGLAVIKNGIVTATYGTEQGINNPEFLTVSEGDNGDIYCGSDGDGIYVIGKQGISKIGRDQGLSSDVVMKIKKDSERGVYWIITSNSIECLRNGTLKTITSIPYNNNYDIFFNSKNEAWILSSYGIFVINAENLVYDYIKDYRKFTIANGLPYSITGNSYSYCDASGNLYIAGREGVIRVNMNQFFDSNSNIKIALNSVYWDDKKITPNAEGVYSLPSARARVKFSVSVLDYTLDNPYVRVFLEGSKDAGITAQLNSLTALEYTRLTYGNYNLHVQVLDENKTDILSSASFSIIKKPMLGELWSFRIFVLILAVIMVGIIVWRFMKSTIIRHQYAEIREAKEEADRANTAKSRFLSNMSKEILVPINTIMGMNEMITREDFTNVPKDYYLPVRNYASNIRNASHDLLSLVTDLLEMTKIETGALELYQSEYDVKEMLNSFIKPVRKRIQNKDIRFNIVIEEMLPSRLYGDLAKIRQIMLKLLNNAVKFTEKGSITLMLSMLSRNDDECKLCFTVRDTGTGISPEDVATLFDASPNQNNNLGLNIFRRFAELMGGELNCESVFGEGTEFTFSFKQKISDSTPVGTYYEEDDNASIRDLYIPEFIAPDADILVADANQMNLEIIKNLLKATKVFVTTSLTAEDAAENIRKNFFNIVFIDQMLIKNSEKEFIDKIREKHPELPVYVITENIFTAEQNFKVMGYNGCILTPIDSLHLERIIKQNLPEHMMQSAVQESKNV